MSVEVALPQGMTLRRNPANGFSVCKLHYTADPEKRDPAWIEQAKKGMSRLQWLREMEIDYTVKPGKRVYPEFDPDLHKEPNLAYLPGKTMIRGWDFGYHHPACVFCQFDEAGRFCVHATVYLADKGARMLGAYVLEFAEANFPHVKQYRDWGDPRGNDMSDKSEKTTVQILAGLGISVICLKAPTKRRVDIIRNLMVRNAFRIHPRNTVLIEGFLGQYTYPETKEGEPEDEIPDKDGYYDNPQDAMAYAALGSVTGYGVPEKTQPKYPVVKKGTMLMEELMGAKKPEPDWYNG